MRWEEVEVGSPGPGQVLVRNTAVGLNVIDVYHRIGLYPNALPFTLGTSGSSSLVLPSTGGTVLFPSGTPGNDHIGWDCIAKALEEIEPISETVAGVQRRPRSARPKPSANTGASPFATRTTPAKPSFSKRPR